MRRLLLLTAALTLGIAPIAHADTYTYTFNGQYPEPGLNLPDFETFTIDPSNQPTYVPESNEPSCNAPDCFSSPDLNGDGTRQFIRNVGIENNNSDFLNTVEYLHLYSSSTSHQILSPLHRSDR